METSSNQRILESFKDFFNFQSRLPRLLGQCERCGSALEYFNAHFWFDATERAWSLQFPFCPACDLAIVEDSVGC